MNEYSEVLTDLKSVLLNGRSRKNENIGKKFKKTLKDLHNKFNIDLSTKFLRGLFPITTDNRKKTYRIRYLLKQSGLKTLRQNRYFGGWALQQYNKDVVIYAHTKGKIYNNPCVLSGDEEKQLKDIEKVKIETGINLYPKAQHNLNERQRIRNLINKGGGVRVVDVKTQSVGNFFKIHNKEVLFFIVGY